MLAVRDAFFFTAGIAFLGLAKAKHLLKGYTSPKPFEISESQRCIEYDWRVVNKWLQRSEQYLSVSQVCL